MAYLCSSLEVQDVCERDHQVLSEHKERWFQIKLHFMQVVVGGNANDSGEIQFGEEGIAVVQRLYTHGRVWVTIIIYIANM